MNYNQYMNKEELKILEEASFIIKNSNSCQEVIETIQKMLTYKTLIRKFYFKNEETIKNIFLEKDPRFSRKDIEEALDNTIPPNRNQASAKLLTSNNERR